MIKIFNQINHKDGLMQINHDLYPFNISIFIVMNFVGAYRLYRQ